MPYESRVRAWLMRARVSAEDVDELIQEAYCRLSMLDSVDHIDRPGAYFFSIARNLLMRRLKRQQVVSIEAIAEIEAYQDCLSPSPEQAAGMKLEYDKMLAFLATLPERCRTIVQLRKIDGWSQRQIAEHMGISEKAVEKQVWVGVKAIREAWSKAEAAADDRLGGLAQDRRLP